MLMHHPAPGIIAAGCGCKGQTCEIGLFELQRGRILKKSELRFMLYNAGGVYYYILL